MLRTQKSNHHLTCFVALIAMLTVAKPAIATIVRFDTVLGIVDVRLYDSATPLSTANFLDYTNQGDYTNTLIHRSVSGFIVQGGGWTYDGTAQEEPRDYPTVPQRPAVQNEPGISNLRGTIAYAKLGGDPDSATNQWFFNLADNSANLDNQNGGFTAFGRVLGDGMSVVDSIAALPTFSFLGAWSDAPMRNYSTADFNNFVPVDDNNLVLINSINVLNLPDGDYNFDGEVDGSDLLVWQRTVGSTTDAEADGNGNGIVDAADLALWEANFGAISGVAAIAEIPEPATLALLASAAIFYLAKKRSPRADRRSGWMLPPSKHV